MKVFEIIYSVKQNKNRIKIFNNDFIRKYKNGSKLIYKGKIFPITSEFPITDKNTKKLKIKLITLRKIPDDIFLYCNQVNQFNKQRIYKITNDEIKHIVNIQKLIYKINLNKNKIRIFNNKFVNNNKNKCNLIYKNRIFPLKEYFSIEDIEKEKTNKLIIYLIELENITDLSYMFQDCTALEEYTNLKKNNNTTEVTIDNKTKKEIIYEDKNNKIEKSNNFIEKFITMNKFIDIPYSFSMTNSESNTDESQDYNNNAYYNSSFDDYSLSEINTNNSDI